MKTLLLCVSFLGLLLVSSCQEPTAVAPTDSAAQAFDNTNPIGTSQADGNTNVIGKGQ